MFQVRIKHVGAKGGWSVMTVGPFKKRSDAIAEAAKHKAMPHTPKQCEVSIDRLSA